MTSHHMKAVALAVVVVAGLNVSPIQADEGVKAEVLLAPDFALPGLDGKTVRLSDYKGKVVIVDFWATWCPPCRAEIPGFVKMAADYKGRVAIIGISLDEGREKDVRPFYAQYGMNYPVAFGNDAVVAAYGGIRGIPTTFIVTPDQRIALKHVGYADEKFWREEVKKQLGNQSTLPAPVRRKTSGAHRR